MQAMNAQDMPMPVGQEGVTLKGEALYGVGPAHARHLVQQLPQQVRLGRIRPVARPVALKFGEFLDESKALAALPASINRRDKAAVALARMYLNDKYGCCVISGKMHNLGLWSGADDAAVVMATDQEVYSQYQSICGRGDNGCVITHVLDVMRSKGLTAGGVKHKIDGYVTVDNRSQIQTKAAQYFFGAGTIGINLPDAWTEDAVWDVTNSRIVGGHDVSPIDYDEKGVYVASWGRIYLITWAAFSVTRWVEEFYAMLAPLWYGSDNLAPCGLDVTALKKALALLGGGEIPPIPEPPPPPEPPTPPGPSTEPAQLVAYDADWNVLTRYKPIPKYDSPPTPSLDEALRAEVDRRGLDWLRIKEAIEKYGPTAIAVIKIILGKVW